MKTSGVCLYSRFFTNDFKNLEVNLITPFFSAIFSFSEKIIAKKTPEILEMSELRFVFRVQDDFIFIILSDSSASLIFVTSRLSKIADEFFELFPDPSKLKDYQQIEEPKFDEIVDSLITGEEEIYMSKVFYKKIIDTFKELMYENEIVGAAIFTIQGNVIYTSLPNEILVSSLKELEIRYKVGALTLPEMYQRLENGQKVVSKVIDIPWKLDPLLIVILYDNTVPLGMAEVNLDKIAEKIINII
ncbi:hypothetical protein LCGC14_1668470 [marine sediment metagenome]|uniref:Uncharacterized protein n=2 Tax=marine sediment metagenome TaxID=412755 RepID=A0A0F9HSU9_9ZZZZ